MFWITSLANPLIAIEDTNAIAMALKAGRTKITGHIKSLLQQICPDEELMMRKENEVYSNTNDGDNNDD